MFTPSAHVPDTLTTEVPCDGGRLILALTGDRLTILLSTDRPLAVLDAGAVEALRAVLVEAARRMVGA